MPSVYRHPVVRLNAKHRDHCRSAWL
jgi:hypothetical protein